MTSSIRVMPDTEHRLVRLVLRSGVLAVDPETPCIRVATALSVDLVEELIAQLRDAVRAAKGGRG